MLLGAFPVLLSGQTKPLPGYPKSYFIKPLNLPVNLNANFGDFRENHFHSGLDFSTGGKTGLRIVAAAQGYVSRIKVQAGGYGQALYLTHPNGLVTVYAHLDAYAGAIGLYVLQMQYQLQTYELDIHLRPDELPVSKGELVALSGNTGFSGGPHLHFEIRDEHTEEIINPLLFNFPLTDRIPPSISGIYSYRLYHQGGLSRLIPLHYYPAYRSGTGHYHLAIPFIQETGNLIFGIIATDVQNAGSHAHGIYSISLLRDQVPVFRSALTRFGFDQTRSVNSYLDFALFKKEGVKVQRSYIEPGNRIAIYPPSHIREYKALPKDSTCKMQYQVADASGNMAFLDFVVKGTDSSKDNPTYLQVAVKNESVNPAGGTFPLISYNRDTLVYFTDKGASGTQASAQVSMRFPAGALFDNQLIPLKIFSVTRDQPRYVVGDSNIPVKDSVLFGCRLPAGRNTGAGNWVLAGNEHSFTRVFAENGFLKAWITYFGIYHLIQDTLAPDIIQINKQAARPYRRGSKLAFTLHDDLSGIGSYRGEIDGVWELFRYDAKTHLLWHTFVSDPSPGRHTLSLSVADKVGNTRHLLLNF